MNASEFGRKRRSCTNKSFSLKWFVSGHTKTAKACVESCQRSESIRLHALICVCWYESNRFSNSEMSVYMSPKCLNPIHISICIPNKTWKELPCLLLLLFICFLANIGKYPVSFTDQLTKINMHMFAWHKMHLILNICWSDYFRSKTPL